MEKKILEELFRIKNLMGYDRSKPNEIIIKEQGSANAALASSDQGVEAGIPVSGAFATIAKSDARKCRDPKTGINWNPFDSDEDEIRWPETNLGPRYNSPYPITWPKADMVGLPVICSRETGEAVVWQFKGTETAKNFVPNVQVGDVKDSNGILHKDQEYILEKKDNKDVKRCLPVKEWWDVYTKYNIIYKFQNPRTGNIYGMRLTLDEMYFDKSEKCLGKNNGWEFLDFGNYYLKGGKDAYDPKKPEDFDIRSNDDIFWDEYGMYIEIGVGIALAFAIPAIGPLIISGLGLVGIAIPTTAYLGSGISIGLVIIESLAELAILSPLIVNQLERGQNGAAILSILFCGLPFVTEIPAMAKFLRKGLGSFIKTDADELIETIDGLGDNQFLNRIVTLYKQNGSDVAKRYIEQVIPNANQREILYAGLEIITESGNDLNKVVGDTLAHLIIENQEAVAKNIAQRGLSESDKAIQDLGNAILSPFKGPLTGVGFVPSLARGLLIFGPIAIAWNKGYAAVEKYFKDEKEFNYTEEMARKALTESPFFIELANLNFDFKQEIDIVEIVEAAVDKDPNFKDREASVKEKLLVEATKESFKKVIKENGGIIETQMVKEMKSNNNIPAFLSNYSIIDKLQYFSRLISEILINKKMAEYLGSTIMFNKKSSELNFNMNWDFTIKDEQQKSYNGYIKFIGGENGTHEIFIDNKKIFPN
jgi:hypothetical protein